MPRNGIKKQFWLPSELAEKLAEYSRLTKLSETSIIRFLIRGYHPREAPGAEFYEALNKIWEKTAELRNIAWTYRNLEDRSVLMEKADAVDELTNEIEEKFLMPAKVEYDIQEGKITEIY